MAGREAQADSLRTHVEAVGSAPLERIDVFHGKELVRTVRPEDLPRWLALEHEVSHAGTDDLPVHVRVTQADGHQAWSSPIYLIGPRDGRAA